MSNSPILTEYSVIFPLIIKSYVSQQKIALSQEYAGKEKSLKSKFDSVNAHKYKTRKHLGELEDKLYIITKKIIH